MKKITMLFLAALVVCASCNNSESGYTIEFSVEDLAGKKIVLNRSEGGEMMAMDSVILDDTGEGKMEGTAEGAEIMYLATDDGLVRMSLFLDNAVYSVSGTADEIDITAKTGAHAEWMKYQEGTEEFSDIMNQVMKEYQAAAGSGADQSVLDSLRDAYYSAQEQVAEYDSAFRSNNKASDVSLYLLRGSFYSLSIDELEEALQPFIEVGSESPYFKFLSDHLGRMKSVEIGQKYVDFELPDTEGNPVKLSDVAEQGVLLIDFWASWCGPCRRANPGVVEIYNEFHERGFDIIGVSLDRNKEDWLKGIEEDGLTWTQVSDLEFWNSKAGKLYAVSSIPHTVLLDENGIIIAKNLEKEALKAKLEEIL